MARTTDDHQVALGVPGKVGMVQNREVRAGAFHWQPNSKGPNALDLPLPPPSHVRECRSFRISQAF